MKERKLASFPFCIRLKAGHGTWRVLQPSVVDKLPDTVQVVVEAPEFLGMLDPDRGIPRAAIVAPNSGSGRVLLAVDDDGRVLLVACPAATDNGSLATVVGDVLATGGRFWHQSYETLAKLFEGALGQPLLDWMAKRAPEGWSADDFKQGVTQSMDAGRFPVLIVAQQLDQSVRDMLAYFRQMNLDVGIIGVDHYRSEGVEFVAPHQFEGRPASAAPIQDLGETSGGRSSTQTDPGSARPASEPSRHERKPDSTDRPGPKATVADAMGSDGFSEAQQDVLSKLGGLDDLGLDKQGLMYFVPGARLRDTAEGTIVVAVNPDRWPFPSPDEVVVVVNTGLDHLAGYLKLTQEEVEDFLASLPRVARKEHKGCLLLRAASAHEASMLVNELKALREVAAAGL